VTLIPCQTAGRYSRSQNPRFFLGTITADKD
jgi:hypothetical protein